MIAEACAAVDGFEACGFTLGETTAIAVVADSSAATVSRRRVMGTQPQRKSIKNGFNMVISVIAIGKS
jgi:hypothetical protein